MSNCFLQYSISF